MMNDPLLNQPWSPPTPAPEPSPLTTSVQTNIKAPSPRVPVRRSKHPAASSRILALGLSVAAVIGMSAAYTKAQRQQPTQQQVFDTASQPQLSLQAATPASPAQQQSRSNAVQIPLPKARAATGGATQQNSAPTQQKSSGSH